LNLLRSLKIVVMDYIDLLIIVFFFIDFLEQFFMKIKLVELKYLLLMLEMNTHDQVADYDGSKEERNAGPITDQHTVPHRFYPFSA
jgi:hypothetical protein